jgi:glucan phosphoethanolaminetransferase (alkaline phosphatase superfamily)
MEQVIEFFNKLFSAGDWPARWVCGEWSSFHGWLYITSDIAIWLAYFVIPAIIIFFIQKRHNLPFLPVFWLFGAFIILCGSTHLIDAIMFYWPAYRLSALLRVLTALVSMATAFVLIRDLPKLIESKPDEKLKIHHLEKQLKNYEIEIIELKQQLKSKQE